MKSHKDWSVGVMMFPSIFLFLIVSVYPFLWIVRYMPFDYNGFKAYFTGLDNFKRVLGDVVFWKSVIHTFEYAFLKLIFCMPLSMAVAAIIHQKLRGSGFFRTVFFLPTVISSAVYALIFYFIFSAYNGVLNGLLMKAGIIERAIDWLGNPNIAMLSVVIVAVWGGFGNYMILILSGLSSISEEVYESAKIDGANGFQTFFRITLPLLSPVLKVILMLAITNALKDYESILVLTGGGPNNRTQVMFSYIYQLSFGSDSVGTSVQLGYSAVLSVVAAVIIGIITVGYLKISKKMDDVY